jgi:tRNA pseudouridine13 synthase
MDIGMDMGMEAFAHCSHRCIIYLWYPLLSQNKSSLNRFMSAEIAILQSLARTPFDYKKAFGCISKNLRMMFIHAVQSLIWNKATSHRIAKMDRDHILVGDLVPNANKVENSTESKVQIVTEEDIEHKKYTLEDLLVPVVGTKTVFPTNALGAVLKDLLSDLGLTVEMFQKCQDREIRANGDYRKAIIHPKDFDYTIQEYYHPLQPLLPTDLMKLNGDEITIEPPPKKEGEESTTPSSPPKPLIAMVVGFTLPSSSYATIALRELMKTPTSNEFQSKLKLE